MPSFINLPRFRERLSRLLRRCSRWLTRGMPGGICLLCDQPEAICGYCEKHWRERRGP